MNYCCLNIGCGYDVRAGWVNADLVPVSPLVIEVNADYVDWPWPDERFVRIEAVDLIEHLDRPMTFLAECWRVLQPDGKLVVRGPHFTSRDVATDLTHRRGLSSESFLWAAGKRAGWVAHEAMPWSDVHVELEFEWWNTLAVGWVNLHPMLMKLYEATPWRSFPARAVMAELTK